MPPSNLEFTKMNVDNLSENVVPQSATANLTLDLTLNINHLL